MKHIVKYAVVLCMLMGMMLPAQAFAGCGDAEWTKNSTGGETAWQTKWNCGDWVSCLKDTGKKYIVQKENCVNSFCGKEQNVCNIFYGTCTKGNCDWQKDCADGNCNAEQNCKDGSCDVTEADQIQQLPDQTPEESQAEPVNPEQSGTSPQKTPESTASHQTGSQAQQVLALVNQERAAQGLSALALNDELSAVAQAKAEDMAAKGYFSHTSPTYGSPFDMMKTFGISYTAAGENIAKGYDSASSVMNGWMNSPGHRANILNSDFAQLGVGYYVDGSGTAYWVQMFIR